MHEAVGGVYVSDFGKNCHRGWRGELSWTVECDGSVEITIGHRAGIVLSLRLPPREALQTEEIIGAPVERHRVDLLALAAALRGHPAHELLERSIRRRFGGAQPVASLAN